MKNFTPSKNAGILSASLRTHYICRQDYRRGFIVYKGIKYTVEGDLLLNAYFQEHPIAKAIVSFQHYPNRESVAVARLHRDFTTHPLVEQDTN